MNEQTSDRKVILAGILVTELRPVLSARYSAYRAAATRRGLSPS